MAKKQVAPSYGAPVLDASSDHSKNFTLHSYQRHRMLELCARGNQRDVDAYMGEIKEEQENQAKAQEQRDLHKARQEAELLNSSVRKVSRSAIVQRVNEAYSQRRQEVSLLAPKVKLPASHCKNIKRQTHSNTEYLSQREKCQASGMEDQVHNILSKLPAEQHRQAGTPLEEASKIAAHTEHVIRMSPDTQAVLRTQQHPPPVMHASKESLMSASQGIDNRSAPTSGTSESMAAAAVSEGGNAASCDAARKMSAMVCGDVVKTRGRLPIRGEALRHVPFTGNVSGNGSVASEDAMKPSKIAVSSVLNGKGWSAVGPPDRYRYYWDREVVERIDSHDAKVALGKATRREVLLQMQASAMCNPHLEGGLPQGTLTRVQSADDLIHQIAPNIRLNSVLSRPVSSRSSSRLQHIPANVSHGINAVREVSNGQLQGLVDEETEITVDSEVSDATVRQNSQKTNGGKQPHNRLAAKAVRETLEQVQKQLAGFDGKVTRGEILAQVMQELKRQERHQLMLAENSSMPHVLRGYEHSGSADVVAGSTDNGKPMGSYRFGGLDEYTDTLNDSTAKAKVREAPYELCTRARSTIRLLSPQRPLSSSAQQLASRLQPKVDGGGGDRSERENLNALPSTSLDKLPLFSVCKSRPPSAKKGRENKEALMLVNLPKYSESRDRQAVHQSRLSTKMQRLWRSIDGSKQLGLLKPANAQCRVNKDLPKWEQWTSLFLVPPCSFQSSKKPVRI